MIIKSIVMCRMAVERIILEKQYIRPQWSLISIYTDKPLENTEELYNLGCQSILSLNFWDITEKHLAAITKKHPEAILFNESHAKKIVDYVDGLHKDPDNIVSIAHCDAGVSRSGAVGEFTVDYCGLDYAKFMISNPYIKPNSYILNLLRRQAGLIPLGA